jgi:hypothetical protein
MTQSSLSHPHLPVSTQYPFLPSVLEEITLWIGIYCTQCDIITMKIFLQQTILKELIILPERIFSFACSVQDTRT